MPRPAIDYYHSLLTPELAEETDALMRKLLKERGLYFGDRPLCVVLRPHFYLEAHWTWMKARLDILLSAFRLAHEACMANAELRAELMMEDYEEALLPYDQPRIPPWSTSRLDTFYIADKGVLKCVEYNAETPAGMGYADVLNEVFSQLEPMKRFAERYHVRYMHTLGRLKDAILAVYRAWGGTSEPQIGIVDWSEVPTLNEHEITRAYFERQGLKARLADPRLLEYRDGHLWAEDFRIDMIYKRVLFSELVHRMGQDNAILRAYRDGAVFITNSISAKLLAKKASLAFLSDEAHEGMFNKQQLKAIDDHIPWTRVVKERKTLYGGRTIDLLPFLADNREHFVLKPNDEYGGSGVVLGWECSQEGWEAALHQATLRPYVVQERVDLVEKPFPSWIAGALDISPRYVDADPYGFGGDSVEACMTRLSSLSLLNVTAGGGSIVPTVLIEPI
ncbi:MAG: circularly permuted type 2 ATP-grasp protein [Anaerolineae bacterium]|nr:circularly permuted type 2 ATP-grasp protein [Anaerolineae bacterium]MDW8173623.1 circularly permuted type 2 ATP-grasp protein [Anaerolineae bacterium]